MVRVLFPVLMLSAVLSGSARAQGAAIDWEGGIPAPLNLPQALDASTPKPPAAAPKPLCIVQLEDKGSEGMGAFRATLIASMGPLSKGVRVHSVAKLEAPRKPGDPPREETREADLRGDDDEIDAHGGVPNLTPNQILKEYKDEVDQLLKNGTYSTPGGKINWTLPAGSPCTALDLSMTMFWVIEWFYYG